MQGLICFPARCSFRVLGCCSSITHNPGAPPGAHVWFQGHAKPPDQPRNACLTNALTPTTDYDTAALSTPVESTQMLSLSVPPPDASRRHERNHIILRPVGLAAAAVGLPDLMVHLMPSASWSGEVLSSSSSLKLRLGF